MPDTILYEFGNGDRAIITFGRDGIKCPTCGKERNVGGLLERKPGKDGCWKVACTSCKRRLGVTFDMRGDAVCWDHKEAVAEQKRLNALPQPTAEETAAFLAELAAMPPTDHEAEVRALLAKYEAKHSLHTIFAGHGTL